MPGEQLSASTGSRPELRVAVIGHAFMGAAHSQAWRTAPHVFDLPYRLRRSVICGRDAEAVTAAAGRLGWERAETDWRRVVTADDVDLVDICTPGDSHAEIAVAALAAGKHVLCEKPLANTVPEAERMAAAARLARLDGVRSMTGMTYRRVPALALAARLVRQGRIGQVRHVRVQYLQDWLVDPRFPLTWRLRREAAGSGALGDLGVHALDLVQHLTGERLVGVSAVQSTFIDERPLPAGPDGSPEGAAPAGTGRVTVDDATALTGRLSGGGLVVMEVTRFATGRKNALRLELNGSLGSLAFDLEAMNELLLHDGTLPAVEAGFRRILVTEAEHPYLSAWWPPGHALGYEHAFTHQVRDLVLAISDGRDPEPSFADGLDLQRILDAVQRSVADGSRWVPFGWVSFDGDRQP